MKTEPETYRKKTYLKKIYSIIKSYLGTTTIVYGFFAAIFGSIPLLNIIKRLLSGFKIEIQLPAIPRILSDQYDAIWRSLIQNIINLASSFEMELPHWVLNILTSGFHDLLTIYILIAFGVHRGNMVARQHDQSIYLKDRDNFIAELELAARLHQQDPNKLIEKVQKGLRRDFKGLLYFYLRSASSSIRWPVVIYRNYAQVSAGIADGHALRLLMVWSFMTICAVGGALFYLLFSSFA